MATKLHWRGLSILTPHELRRRSRRLDHKIRNVEHVLAQMRAGAQLLLHYSNGKPTWQLNPGDAVAPKTALDVIKHVGVCSVGDCLFADCPAQIFHYIEG